MNKKTIVAGLIFSLASTISTGISAQVVQDPYFTNQYYLEMINVIDAWEITKGDPSVIVTITDEPIETNHEDISSSKIVQTYGGSAFDNRAHGMAVGGIMFADHNNKGIAGIAPNVSIVGIATWSIFGPTNDATLKNLSIDAAEDGSILFNHSWTNDGSLTQYQNSFLNQVEYSDIIHIAAAGNKNKEVTQPASFPAMYAVGAVDQSLNRWHYSNFGSKLRIVGPNGEIGENILEDHPCYDGVNSVNAGLQGLKMRGDIWTLDLSGQSGYNPGNLNVNTTDCWGKFEHLNPPVGNTNYSNDFSGTSANALLLFKRPLGQKKVAQADACAKFWGFL
ncbi:MAG: S8 family serine peptidase [Balneolaceae bacterium]|nr:S8 family serine peptidase [Balneolaceae bacterium]